jgi:hypothetical protein
MPLLIGIIFLALGLSLCVMWWSPAFVAALQVLVVISLLLWGVILTLVGYSAMKASREFDEAVNSESDVQTAESATTSTREEAAS